MVVSDLFNRSGYATDGDNRLLTSPNAECTMTLASGTGEGGSIFQIFDSDTTTLYYYYYSSAANSVDHTYTVTLDYFEKKTAKVLWVYFGAYNNGTHGPFCTVTLQVSVDGTNWTNLETVTATNAGAGVSTTTTKSYEGASIGFRYIRFSNRAQNGAGSGTSIWRTLIYEVWATMT